MKSMKTQNKEDEYTYYNRHFLGQRGFLGIRTLR